MNARNLSIGLLVVAALATSCKSSTEKDAAAKATIEKTLDPGVSVSVKDGVATISGSFTDEATREKTLKDIKATAGIKSIDDQSTLMQAPEIPSAEAVSIHADHQLNSDLKTILSAYPSVQATVNEGIVTLTGSIERNSLSPLMQAVNAAHPKKVENKLQIK
ncbi:BON domain-containing protein [Flavobacterium sp. JP2137]|uniref:BON domain-containing protein n=1 Tax=Flavobacterium sp. JP2137 TaxID=3414510 RepID=UPI003D2FE48C